MSISNGQNEESKNGNRQANQENNGSTSQGTSDSSGTAKTLSPHNVALFASARYATGYTSGGRAGLGFGFFHPTLDYQSVPDEGIIVGEITAWRIWRIDDYKKVLRSYAMDTPWYNGTMEGNPECFREGVYALKELPSHYKYTHLAGISGIIAGRVKLWGNIVEHEEGYRAQYAKITHLDYGEPKILRQFREIYGVGGERIWPKWLTLALIIIIGSVGVAGIPFLLNWLFP